MIEFMKGLLKIMACITLLVVCTWWLSWVLKVCHFGSKGEGNERILNTYPKNGTLDNWGTPISILKKKENIEKWVLISAGPDKQMGSQDDIIKVRYIYNE